MGKLITGDNEKKGLNSADVNTITENFEHYRGHRKVRKNNVNMNRKKK